MAITSSDPDLDITPAHWVDTSTPIAKLAKLCKMSVPTVQAALPMKIPVEDLKTFDDAEVARHFGCITEKEWREFCYDWRDSVFRFSDTGKEDAAEHAKRNQLPPPQSDRSGS